MRKTVDGVGTDYLHAGDMEIAEYDSDTGELLRRYIPGAGTDQRVAIVECRGSAHCEPGRGSVQTRFYLADRQGNVLAVQNENGQLHQQFFYTPFGVELVGDASGNPFRYTGRRHDPETGLYYYRARYYDPDLGRFLQVDPIGYEDQWNLYAYVGNNPLNATDPTGEFGIVGGLIGAAIGAAVETGVQLYQNGGDLSAVDGGAVLRSAVVGGAIGATGGLAGAAIRGGTVAARGAVQGARILNSTAGRVTQGIVEGGVGGAGGEVAAQLIDDGAVTDVGAVGEAALRGGTAGGAGGLVGGQVQRRADQAGLGRVSADRYAGNASGRAGPFGDTGTSARLGNASAALTNTAVDSAQNHLANNEPIQDDELNR